MPYSWRITERGLWVSEELIAFTRDDKSKHFRVMRISDKLTPIFYSKGHHNALLEQRFFDMIKVFGSDTGHPTDLTFEDILLAKFWTQPVGDGMVNIIPIDVLERLPAIMLVDTVDYMIFKYKNFY